MKTKYQLCIRLPCLTRENVRETNVNFFGAFLDPNYSWIEGRRRKFDFLIQEYFWDGNTFSKTSPPLSLPAVISLKKMRKLVRPNLFEPKLLEVLDFHNLKYVQLVQNFKTSQHTILYIIIIFCSIWWKRRVSVSKISRLESPARMKVEILPPNVPILKNIYCY